MSTVVEKAIIELDASNVQRSLNMIVQEYQKTSAQQIKMITSVDTAWVKQGNSMRQQIRGINVLLANGTKAIIGWNAAQQKASGFGIVRQQTALAGTGIPGAGVPGKGAQSMNVSWESFNRLFQVQMLHRGVAMLTSGLRDGFSAAVNLQVKLGEIAAISQSAFTDTARWAREIGTISTRYGMKLEDVTEAVYQTVSNQVAFGSDAVAFAGEASKLAIATGGGVTDAVNALSSIINAYGESASRANYYSALLFKTVELGRVRLGEMAQMGDMTIMGAQLGVTFEELSAAIISLTNQGLKFNRVNTQIRGMMTKLLKPTKAMQGLYDDLGVSSGQAFTRIFGLAGGLRMINEITAGNAAEVAKYQNNIRGMVATLGLTSEVGAQKFTDAMAKIKLAQISFDNAVKINMELPARRWLQTTAELRRMFVTEFGQDAIRVMNVLGGALVGVTPLLRTITVVLANTFAAAGIYKIVRYVQALKALRVAAGAAGVGIVSIAAAIAVIATILVTSYESAVRKTAEAIEIALRNIEALQQSAKDATHAAFKDLLTDNARVQLLILSSMRIAAREAIGDINRELKDHEAIAKDVYTQMGSHVSKYTAALDSAIEKHRRIKDSIDKMRVDLPRETASAMLEFDLGEMEDPAKLTRMQQHVKDMQAMMRKYGKDDFESAKYYHDEVKRAILQVGQIQKSLNNQNEEVLQRRKEIITEIARLEADTGARNRGEIEKLRSEYERLKPVDFAKVDVRSSYLSAVQEFQKYMDATRERAHRDELRKIAERAEAERKQLDFNIKYEAYMRFNAKDYERDLRYGGKTRYDEITAQRQAELAGLKQAGGLLGIAPDGFRAFEDIAAVQTKDLWLTWTMAQIAQMEFAYDKAGQRLKQAHKDWMGESKRAEEVRDTFLKAAASDTRHKATDADAIAIAKQYGIAGAGLAGRNFTLSPLSRLAEDKTVMAYLRQQITPEMWAQYAEKKALEQWEDPFASESVFRGRQAIKELEEQQTNYGKTVEAMSAELANAAQKFPAFADTFQDLQDKLTEDAGGGIGLNAAMTGLGTAVKDTTALIRSLGTAISNMPSATYRLPPGATSELADEMRSDGDVNVTINSDTPVESDAVIKGVKDAKRAGVL